MRNLRLSDLTPSDLRSAKIRLTERTLRIPGGHLLWIGNKTGVIHFGDNSKGRRIQVARLAFELTHGPLPRGKEVCHKCDIPHCLAPAHLWAGTHAENMTDAARKGRMGRTRGSRHGQSKLVESQIPRIRRLKAQGWTHARIAEKFHVTRPLIGHILNGRSWTHV